MRVRCLISLPSLIRQGVLCRTAGWRVQPRSIIDSRTSVCRAQSPITDHFTLRSRMSCVGSQPNRVQLDVPRALLLESLHLRGLHGHRCSVPAPADCVDVLDHQEGNGTLFGRRQKTQVSCRRGSLRG